MSMSRSTNSPRGGGPGTSPGRNASAAIDSHPNCDLPASGAPYGCGMSRQSTELLAARADAANAALASAIAARDANAAREILGSALAEIHALADAVVTLNQGLGALKDEREALTAQVATLHNDGETVTARLAALQHQVDELAKVGKKGSKTR